MVFSSRHISYLFFFLRTCLGYILATFLVIMCYMYMTQLDFIFPFSSFPPPLPVLHLLFAMDKPDFSLKSSEF